MGIRDERILIKIYDEITIIDDMINNVDFSEFDNDEKIKRAVCMTLINIGELVKNLTEEFRNENMHIPWREIAGLRDITAHRYQTLKMEDIWETVKTDLPIIKIEVKRLIA